MSEDQQHKIDESEYDTLMRAVAESGLSALEKDNLRELLGAGYRNLNGDPMEVKVRMLARTDWIQIKHTLADADRMNEILGSLREIKEKLDAKPEVPAEQAQAQPRSFSDKLFGFLTAAKRELATIICFAIFFPNGGKVLKVLASFVNPGVQP